MAEGLSEHDQALVNAFLAKRGVTKVPAGTSGIPQAYWDGSKLVYGEHGWKQKQTPGIKKRKDAAARRGRAVMMAADGMSIDAIAAAMEITTTTVLRYLREAGAASVSDVAPGVTPGRLNGTTGVTREKVRLLHAQGRSTHFIAQALEINRSAVQYHLRQLGLTSAGVSKNAAK